MTESRTIVITGGAGLLGLCWARGLSSGWRVHLTLHERIVAFNEAATHKTNLADRNEVTKLLDEVRPDLVVHTAGMTSVEACELRPSLAETVNVAIPANIARSCSEAGVRFVHISTDHLFSNAVAFRDEDVPPEPLNHYARTKALGEKAALEADSNALVIRTNFYGWGPSYRRSFSDRIIDALRADQQIPLFTDVYFTPILTDTLVQVVHDLVGKNAKGVYNVVGDDRISKYEFGLRLADAFGLDPRPIQARRLAATPGLTLRPLEMSLSNAKATSLIGYHIGGIREQLHRLAATESDQKVKDVQAL